MRNKTRISILITAIQDCTKKEEKEKKNCTGDSKQAIRQENEKHPGRKKSKIISICS